VEGCRESGRSGPVTRDWSPRARDEVPAWWHLGRHPLAVELEGTPPSADLATRLEALAVADCDDEALLEIVAGWERMGAWVAARQAVAIAEMVRRARGSQVALVPDEVAVRLGMTRRAGEVKATLATCLEAHPGVADALAAGWIDARKADVMLAGTEHLPEAVASQVLTQVLVGAGTRTVPQLRSDLRAADLALDPDAAARRHEVARRERCVRMVSAPDAMAWVHAFLPAPDAIAVMTGLDALAARACADDERTTDERRADALAALARTVLDSGTALDGKPLTVRQHRRPHLSVTVSAQTLTGGGSGVAELAGYGLVPFAAVSSLIAGAVTEVVTTTPDGTRVPVRARSATSGPPGYRPSTELVRRVVERDRTCRFPGCRVPAWRCDLDHRVPFEPDRPAVGPTTAENLQCLCRHHHRLKTLAGWRVSRDPESGATMWVSPTGRLALVCAEPATPDPDPPRGQPRSRGV